MAPYYRAMTLLVNTSLSEGMCSAILEAMASELPVVTSDIPANRLLVNDGEDGYLVPVDDAEHFAQRIIELLRKPIQAHEMGRAGRKRWRRVILFRQWSPDMRNYMMNYSGKGVDANSGAGAANSNRDYAGAQ